MEEEKKYSFLQQAFVFTVIMLLSNVVSKFLFIPIPASVLGLVFLFFALVFKIIKLEHVESLGGLLTGLVSFLFVPSGISVVKSLGIMKDSGIQIVLTIFIATVLLLAVTGWSTILLLRIRKVIGLSNKN
ncbi:antiholin-like murein hydrolase modulator LrgA [Vagococcus intermedius]|uniref:Antiholin-like murein hydrolase modulator LrgA n=1 Tax=Vagococcus intermedius TaxID=2991418 RepID=A0AAF0CVX1_9ENTE|nr:antiholin-like murein hydrolase modulator LrgA [Vagococcus intermedius]WEG73970.1 antiholin-like murein hydrolase modulator LrgA [Vagococcus intermedius]WEG76050.1 antiholin-like murein hydrolase modulator LrgA [Vagococcus intermedius]